MSEWFRNSLGELVYLRSYARWLEDEKRRETWPETVQRVVDFLFKEKQMLDDTLVEELHTAMLNQDVMPSMRSLWSSGEYAEIDNTCIYNCSFLPMDNLRAFSELIYILMQGTGGGFSVESRFVDKLPVVEEIQPSTEIHHQVEDSSEGWGEAVYFSVLHAWKGYESIVLDYSLVRPRGARLKTKGGRASGPEPLQNALSFLIDVIRGAEGRKLKTLEVYDMCCAIAEVVVVGGVRRSAMISFSDPNDESMRHAKDWKRGNFPIRRYMSNNSAYFSERPTKEVFDREWKQLAESGSGERGLSIDNWHKYAPRPKNSCRSNPCVTGDTRVMTEDGLLQIKDFLGQAKSLVIDSRFGTGEYGYTSEKGAFVTGEREVFKLTTKQGYSLKLTADHQVMTSRGWVEAQDLMLGDKIHVCNVGGMFGSQGDSDLGMLAGWYAGDGTIANQTPRLYFYHEDRDLAPMFADAVARITGKDVNVCSYEETKRQSIESALLREYLSVESKTDVPEYVWQGTEACQKAYLSALFSADGCVLGNQTKGVSIRLHSVDVNHLSAVQQILLNFNIFSKIYNNRMKAGIRMLPDGRGGERGYWCKESAELVISRQSLQVFSKRIGFIRKDKQEKLEGIIDNYQRAPYADKFYAEFVGLESMGVETVYDLTENTTHSFIANGLVVHNCHEIGLRFKEANDPWTGEGGGGQFCNLSAAIVRPNDTLESLKNKVRLATIIGCVQATFTHFPYLRPAWRELCEEDRLIGVDLTGQCDNPKLLDDADNLSALNEVAVSTAEEFSTLFGINMPAAITCGKPSGNTSQMVDCASGFHPRYSEYYFRHVRISADDPLSDLLKSQGVPMFPEVGQEELSEVEVKTWVARFPIKSPQGSMLRDDETSFDQMSRYLQIMQNWCKERGHNQSATIYVKEEDWGKVGEWVWENFDEVVGLSFLPYDGGNYKLAPYEEISQEEYQDCIQDFPEIDFSKLALFEEFDQGEGASTLACVGGACEI